MAVAYFKAALILCRLTGVRPSLLLHPLDFLGSAEIPELSFFPGMKLSRHAKLKLVGELIRCYSQWFTVVTLDQHAQAFASGYSPVIAEATMGAG